MPQPIEHSASAITQGILAQKQVEREVLAEKLESQRANLARLTATIVQKHSLVGTTRSSVQLNERKLAEVDVEISQLTSQLSELTTQVEATMSQVETLISVKEPLKSSKKV